MEGHRSSARFATFKSYETCAEKATKGMVTTLVQNVSLTHQLSMEGRVVAEIFVALHVSILLALLLEVRLVVMLKYSRVHSATTKLEEVQLGMTLLMRFA
jgi:hypothetical protein